jgi:predicted metallopeptidase
MKYEFASDIQKIAEEISRILFPHVRVSRIRCFRSYGSSSRNTVARCHTIGKIMQKAMGTQAFYALEFLSERFDKMDKEEQIKVIIHELMHIPNTFGGGFRHHDWVCDKNINKCYRTYKENRDRIRKEDTFGLTELKWKNEDNLKDIDRMKKDNGESKFYL